MPAMTIEYSSDQERQALEQAVAFVKQMNALAQSAPQGQILPACEGLALDRGHDLLRVLLQQAVASRIASAEQKGGLLASAPVKVCFPSNVSANVKS
jgi:hypothetical protein